jgi:glycosyltransferase involved in cell wall biosynthesis
VRILVLNQYFHPDQSATSQLLTELCEDLAEVHQVVVVAGRPSYNPVEEISSRGIVSTDRHGSVEVRRVWSTSFDRSSMPRRLTNYFTYLCASVIGAMSAGRPDVVVAFTDPPLIGLIGAGTAILRRVPLVMVTKDIFPEVAVVLGRLNRRLVIELLRWPARWVYATADRVVSIGDDMTAKLTAFGVPAAKIRTIRDWADGTSVRPLEHSPLRRDMAWEGRFVVAHSGNVGLSQSLDTVIEAADLLRDEPAVLFAVIGEGATKRALVNKVKSRGLSNVAFLPYQPKDRLSESLGAADVHLVSLRRGLAGFIVPSKVYGIMAAGKPFIAAVESLSEPARIVERHRCGVRIEPDDPAALAAAILRMREAPLDDMGLRARAAFEQFYDRPIATSAYRRLLEESATDHRRNRAAT